MLLAQTGNQLRQNKRIILGIYTFFWRKIGSI